MDQHFQMLFKKNWESSTYNGDRDSGPQIAFLQPIHSVIHLFIQTYSMYSINIY